VTTEEPAFASPRLPEWARAAHDPNDPNVPNAPNDPNDLETRIGGRWLQHAGLIVLLLGIAFFLRYAFEREWLSPTIRVSLGVVAGIAMAWGGVRLASKYRAYGLLLAGGGIAALYLSFYAALNLYALVGPEIAYILGRSEADVYNELARLREESRAANVAVIKYHPAKDAWGTPPMRAENANG